MPLKLLAFTAAFIPSFLFFTHISQPLVPAQTFGATVSTFDSWITTNSAATSTARGNLQVNKNLWVNGTSTLATTTTSVLNGVIVVDGVRYAKTGAGIQSALTANALRGGGEVYIPKGVYIFNSDDSLSFFGAPTKLTCAGASTTILQANTVTGGIIYDYFGEDTDPNLRPNIEISGCTFDVNYKSNVSAIQFGSNNNLAIHHNTILHVKDVWGVAIGSIGGQLGSETPSDYATTSSRGARFEFNEVASSTFGTHEGVLCVNCRDYSISHNYFHNLTQGAAAFAVYMGSTNGVITNNIVASSSIKSFYSSGADHYTLSNNTFYNAENVFPGSHIQIFNTTFAHVHDNIMVGENNGSSGSGGILIYDYATKIDGHNTTQWATTSNISIDGNIFHSGYYGVVITDISAGSNKHYEKHDIDISNNQFIDTLWKPVDISVTGAEPTLKLYNIFIHDNKMASTSKLFSGGSYNISGSSTNPQLIRNIYLYNNSATTSTAGGNSAGIYIDGADTVKVYENNVTGTGRGSWDDIEITGNVTNYQTENLSSSGLDISAGCFSVGLVCVTNPFTVSGNLISTSSARFGIGTSSPDSAVSFNQYTGRALLHIGDNTTNNSMTRLLVENRWNAAGGYGLIISGGNSNAYEFTVDGNGNVGIGATTTAGSILSINNLANFTTSTSTFYSTGGINLTGGGCFAINGTCLGTGNGTVGSGLTNQLAYYTANGTSIAGSSTITLISDGSGASSTGAMYYRGLVTVVSKDGTTKQYNATTSSNIGNGTALLTAVNNASDGATIYLAAANYDIQTSPIDLSIGGTGTINLRGAGKYSTRIMTANFDATLTTVHPGLYTTVSDLWIDSNITTTGYYQFPWGFRSTQSSFASTTLQNVYITGVTDGIYMQRTPSTAYLNATSTANFVNVSIFTLWDAVYVNQVATTTLNFYDSDITVIASTTQSNLIPFRNIAHGTVISMASSTVNFFNTNVSATGYLDEGVGYAFSATNAASPLTANIYGGKIVTGGASTTAPTADYDIRGSGAVIINVTANTVYDTAKTSGTITRPDADPIIASIRQGDINFGLATTSPGAILSIAGTSTPAFPLMLISTSTASATSTALLINSLGNITANGTFFVTGSSTLASVTIRESTTTAATTSVLNVTSRINVPVGGILIGNSASNAVTAFGGVDCSLGAGTQRFLYGLSSIGVSLCDKPNYGFDYPNTNFNTSVNATTGIVWFKSGLHASSTSYFANLISNATSSFLANLGVGSSTPSSRLSVLGTTTLGGYVRVGTTSPLGFNPTNLLEAWADNPAGADMGIGNRNAGTGAYAELFLNNDLTDPVNIIHYAVLGLNSSNYSDTTYGTFSNQPNSMYLTNTDGNIAINSATDTIAKSYIIFGTGGINSGNERMRIDGSGLVGIGSTTPYALLSLSGYSGGTIPLLMVSTSTASATTTTLMIDKNGNLTAFSSTTLTNFTARKATTTNATTTTLAIVGISGSTQCLHVDTNGIVTGTGSDCGSGGGGGGANPFTATTNYGATTQATSAVLWLQNGIQASSTSYVSNMVHTGSTTLQDFTGRMATVTNATATNIVADRFKLSNPTAGAILLQSSFDSTFTSYSGASCSTGFVAAIGAAGSVGCSLATFQYGGNGTTTFYSGAIPFSNGSILTETAIAGTLYWDNINFRLSLGSTTPGSMLSITGASLGTQNIITVSTSTASATTTVFSLDKNGNLLTLGGAAHGIGTSTPWGLLSINANGGSVPYFAVGSSSATLFTITKTGNTGIGTTSPWAAFTLDRMGALASSTIAINEYRPATSTAATIDCRTSIQHHWRIGASATTLTLAGMIPGQTCRVIVENPNSTAGALTWAAPSGWYLQWIGGTTPTQTTTANHSDVWSFVATQGSSTPVIIGIQSANAF